jgi:hypothetical protein
VCIEIISKDLKLEFNQMAPRELTHRRGEYLAVLGDNSDFWLCRAAQHVYKDTEDFNIQWLEKNGYN